MPGLRPPVKIDSTPCLISQLILPNELSWSKGPHYYYRAHSRGYRALGFRQSQESNAQLRGSPRRQRGHDASAMR